MADNDQLLQQIGKLIDTKLEAEREHTRKLVREEIEAEAKKIKHDNTLNFFTLGNRLERVENGLKDVEISNGRLEQGQHSLHEGQGKLETMLEAVLAGQKEIQETMATKADILTVGVKVDKLRKRIEDIEEHTGSSTHKN